MSHELDKHIEVLEQLRMYAEARGETERTAALSAAIAALARASRTAEPTNGN